MSARPRRARALRHALIIGRGKLGRALARGLRAASVRVTAIGARDFTGHAAGPGSVAARAAAHADLIVLAVRDAQIAVVAGVLAELPRASSPVAHCAGAIGVEVLAPLRARGRPVAAIHPLLAFSDEQRSPALHGAALLISGEEQAVRSCRQLARRVGMTPVVVGSIDRAAYHAAAALLANGAAALAALAADVLADAGLPRAQLGRMLGPLLASVGANVLSLGPARALSGPVRRGDAGTVKRHLEALRGDTGRLYRSLVQAQLPLARALGEAAPEQLAELERWLAAGADRSPAGPLFFATSRRGSP